MSEFPDYRIGPEAFKYFKMAYEFQMQGEFEKAIFYYKKSLEIEPTAEAYTFLGWTYSFMGRLEEAIEQCQKAIAIDPEFGNPYNDIGAYLLQMGKFDEAIPWLEKAKKAKRYENPEFPYCNLGRIYELKGLWPLAVEEYKKALEIRPDYEPALIALRRLSALLN
ncbi:MAG: tetratricopeptide repeat protein [Calditrichaeota bacterium]|nr:MAG: tetratricopeptide repeat protein [Calditrichota bacterium]